MYYSNRAIQALVTAGLLIASTFVHAQTQELPPEAAVDDLLNSPLFDVLQDHGLTSGELADLVESFLDEADLRPVIDRFQGSIPADLPGGLNALLTPLLDSARSGANIASLVTDFAIFRFITRSGDIERSHIGVLNVPMPLDVDGRLGPDVLAVFSLVPLQGGSFTVEMKVTRLSGTLGKLPLLGALVSKDLPLDIRTQIDIPLAAITGDDNPTMRIELGFASSDNMPTSTALALPVNLNLIGGDSPELDMEWTTEEPGDDLALVLDVKQENPATSSFDKFIGLALANVPVVNTFALGLQANPETTRFSARSSSDTALNLNVDLPDIAQMGATIDQLPRQIDVSLGATDINYSAGAAIARLLVDVKLAQGLDMEAALRDVPDTLAIDFGGLASEDGSEIAIGFDGQSIGEIEFTLTDGPAARNVPVEVNGLVADLSQGLVIGARLKGFTGLQASLGLPLSLGVQILTDAPFVVDADLPDENRVDVALSNIPDDIGLTLEFDNLIDAHFFTSVPVNQITMDADFAQKTFAATLKPLPADMLLCVTQGGNRCTGATAGSVVDGGFYASERINLEMQACLDEDGCEGNLLAERVDLRTLSFQNFEVSMHTRDTKLAGINIPNGAGQLWINTDNQPVVVDAFAVFGNTQILLDFVGSALNRSIRYNAGTPFNLIEKSGSMICQPFDFTVAVGNAVISSGLPGIGSLKNIICSN